MSSSPLRTSPLDIFVIRYTLNTPPVICWAFGVALRSSKALVRPLCKIIYYVGGNEVTHIIVPNEGIEWKERIGAIPVGVNVMQVLGGGSFGYVDAEIDNNAIWFAKTLIQLGLNPIFDKQLCRKWIGESQHPAKPIRALAPNLTEKQVTEAGLHKFDLLIFRRMLHHLERHGIPIHSMSLAGLPPGNCMANTREGMIEPDFYIQWQKTHPDKEGDRQWRAVFKARDLITAVIQNAGVEHVLELKLADEHTDPIKADYSCLGLIPESHPIAEASLPVAITEEAFTHRGPSVTARAGQAVPTGRDSIDMWNDLSSLTTAASSRSTNTTVRSSRPDPVRRGIRRLPEREPRGASAIRREEPSDPERAGSSGTESRTRTITFRRPDESTGGERRVTFNLGRIRGRSSATSSSVESRTQPIPPRSEPVAISRVPSSQDFHSCSSSPSSYIAALSTLSSLSLSDVESDKSEVGSAQSR